MSKNINKKYLQGIQKALFYFIFLSPNLNNRNWQRGKLTDAGSPDQNGLFSLKHEKSLAFWSVIYIIIEKYFLLYVIKNNYMFDFYVCSMCVCLQKLYSSRFACLKCNFLLQISR